MNNIPTSYTASTPQQLLNIIKSALGAPVINIEVSDEQIYMCIQRTLELYGEYHFNGSNKSYKVITINDAEGTKGTFDLKDQRIYAVSQIIRSGGSLLSAMKSSNSALWVWDIVKGFMAPGSNGCSGAFNNGVNIFGGDLGYLEQIMQRQKMLSEFMNPIPDYWYNETTGQLKIFDNLAVGDFIIVEVWTKAYPEMDLALGPSIAGSAKTDGFEVPNYTKNELYENPGLNYNGQARAGSISTTSYGAFNNRWVKEYSINLVKYTWGHILSKHQNMFSAGGTTVDGLRMMDQAQTEMDKLREEVEDSDVPILFMG